MTGMWLPQLVRIGNNRPDWNCSGKGLRMILYLGKSQYLAASAGEFLIKAAAKTEFKHPTAINRNASFLSNIAQKNTGGPAN